MTQQFFLGRRLSMRRIATLVAMAASIGLAGCAQQRIRDESERLVKDGSYEQAVTSLQVGLKDYPESPLLRAGLINVRNEAMNRLLAQAATARSAGKLDEAEALLKRAAAFDTSGKRIEALLFDVATERRQRKSLAEAEALVTKKQPDAALRVIADALKDSPRQPDLLALQRRLEVDVRQSQVKAARQGLSETRPISLDFRDANLRTVLDVMTRNSGVNFILDKDIRPDVRVTVFLRSARVEDAIDLITSTYQLSKKVIDSQTILIYPNTPEKQREHQEQVVRVFYLASAEAKNAAAFLKSMLRIRDPYVDERSNMLAIREAPENIELAERLIALYDTNEPEVLLEVEVMEVRTSRLTDLGVQFPDSFSLTTLGPSGSTGLTLGNIRNLTRNDIGVSVGGLLVNLKRQVGDFNTLANPRIRARNKEKAKVLIGDKVPVITATTGTGGFVSDSVSYIDVGLKLDVEPTVYADDEVAIKVGLEVSSIANQVRTNSGTLAYQIGTRNASTVLRLRDGETQLLAGLISNEDRSAANRVPGIGDLPVMGRLFSSQRDEANRTELVLAITPRVLRNLRRPDANETELWVGTEASPRIRPVGGRMAVSTDAPANAAGQNAGAGPAMNAPGITPGTPQATDASPASPSITMKWRGPGEVKVGDVFVATLELNTPASLRGAPMQFAFSKDKLTLVDVDEGEFFRQGGAPTSFSKNIEASEGRARVGVLRNQATGTSGQGTLVSFRLKALAAGAADLSLTGIEPITLGEPAPKVQLPQTLRLQVK